MLELCSKFGPKNCYGHRYQCIHVPEVHFMTSREITFGFDFWLCAHLRLVVFSHQMSCSYIHHIRSYWVSKIQDGGYRHLGFSSEVNFARSSMLIVWCLSLVPNLVQISLIVTEVNALLFLRINFRFRFLVTWSSPNGHDAYFHQRIYTKFGANISIRSGDTDIVRNSIWRRRHLGFSRQVNLARFGIMVDWCLSYV